MFLWHYHYLVPIYFSKPCKTACFTQTHSWWSRRPKSEICKFIFSPNTNLLSSIWFTFSHEKGTYLKLTISFTIGQKDLNCSYRKKKKKKRGKEKERREVCTRNLQFSVLYVKSLEVTTLTGKNSRNWKINSSQIHKRGKSIGWTTDAQIGEGQVKTGSHSLLE